jgi:hypothetical protein
MSMEAAAIILTLILSFCIVAVRDALRCRHVCCLGGGDGALRRRLDGKVEAKCIRCGKMLIDDHAGLYLPCQWVQSSKKIS